MCLFAGLTSVVFFTGKDFSFLGPIIAIASFVALGFIVCAIIFGFSLGLLFSLAMIVLAGGSILYNTSNVLHRFRMDQHVAAALSLFASVALLFYYVLLALIQSRR
jgi:FtsH-binding integral membrane protein